jgi:hypothetical protein
MAIYNGTKQFQDFVPWPSQGPNRPPKVPGKRVSSKLSRPAENWRSEYATAIFEMTAAGMKPKAIARSLSVRWAVFQSWIDTKYEVQQALAKGSAGLARVAVKGLAMRAAGFEIDSEKVFCDTRTGKVIRAKTREYYPPEPQAALAILRQHVKAEDGEPQPWVPPSKTEITGPGGAPLNINGSPIFNTLMLLGGTPDDQQKAAAAYQQLLRSARGAKK